MSDSKRCSMWTSSCTITERNKTLLKKAMHLLHSCRQTSDDTLYSIFLFLFHAHLCRILKQVDRNDKFLQCFVNVHMALLYYISRHYQTAINHCRVVIQLSSKTDSQSFPVVFEANPLPKFDENVDSVNGMMALYAYLQNRAVDGNVQTRLTSIYTAELFALYVCCRCMSAIGGVRCEKIVNVIERYRVCLREIPSLFCGDLLLFYVTTVSQKQFSSSDENYQESVKKFSMKFHPADLHQLLTIYAEDQLATFFRTLSARYAEKCVVSDLQSMHAYRCEQI
jgi:hypothetical protein